MSLTRYEQETIINFNDEEKMASVYTHNKALTRKLDKLAQERPEECRLIRLTDRAGEYTIPKKWVKVSPPRKVSEQQREQMRERMKNRRFAPETP